MGCRDKYAFSKECVQMSVFPFKESSWENTHLFCCLKYFRSLFWGPALKPVAYYLGSFLSGDRALIWEPSFHVQKQPRAPWPVWLSGWSIIPCTRC